MERIFTATSPNGPVSSSASWMRLNRSQEGTSRGFLVVLNHAVHVFLFE